MAKIIQKKLTFSLIKTIMVIMQVDLLTKLYQSKFNVDFKMILTQLKFDLLNDEIKEYIEETFNDIICPKDEYVEMYSAIELTKELKEFDVKVKKVIPRRLTLEYLEDKKEKVGLTENERMVLYSIKLKQLSTRLHNMGKYGKCTDEEARAVISGVQTMFKKSKGILEKYGRKGEWLIEE